MSSYDVARIRSAFPALADGTAYFDGPGGTQTPTVVGEAIARTLTQPLSNSDTVSVAEQNATAAMAQCRAALGDFLDVDPGAVVVGRSTTQLTMDVARALARHWRPGDEVVLSRLDHDANVRPWVIAAERVGATVRWASFDPATGELDPGQYDDLLTRRTRLVAITGASNLIGTIPDVPAIAEKAHRAGALVHVDAVHRAAHTPVSLAGLGADLVTCSPYKFLGPHCGVLGSRAEVLDQLHPDKLAPSTNELPYRFELGTPQYELMAGVTAAVDFLADLVPAQPGERPRRERLVASMAAMEQHEDRLRDRLEDGLHRLGATVWSRAGHRTSTLLATWEGVDTRALQVDLAARGVNAPSGSFYAYEATRVLGLGDPGGLRMGLAPYTDEDDVDRLLAGLGEALS